ncbi:MAG: hypothetical protein FWD90_00430 [Defluviitaleaceae bacterium]|nr:hypothetical protein [Defluviitaleaceae bacterium]
MIKMVNAVFTLLLLLFLSGCAADAPSPIVGTPRRRTLDVRQDTPTVSDPVPIPYTVLFTQAGATISTHEPVEGAYIGAWLSPDTTHITMRSFGNLAEKSHAIFVYEMELGDEIPLSWLLHAISSDAAPLFYFRLNFNEDEKRLPAAELAELARGLGIYDIPMFLAFNPLARGHGMTPEEYVNVYRLARILFRTYAPKVAFVWVVPEGQSDATPNHPFYPGHDVVDWVGLSVQALRSRDGFGTDIPSAIAPFHHAFQRHKPIMLLPAGISHFSRIDYTYYIKEAAEEILRVYDALAGFPRVKAVIYRDANNVGARWDDMTLTRERDLMLAYAEAIACDYFLDALAQAPAVRQWLRSVYGGYEYDGTFYVGYETLTKELFLSRPGTAVEIDGRSFVDASQLALDITIDTERRIIRINLPS